MEKTYLSIMRAVAAVEPDAYTPRRLAFEGAAAALLSRIADLYGPATARRVAESEYFEPVWGVESGTPFVYLSDYSPVPVKTPQGGTLRLALFAGHFNICYVEQGTAPAPDPSTFSAVRSLYLSGMSQPQPEPEPDPASHVVNDIRGEDVEEKRYKVSPVAEGPQEPQEGPAGRSLGEHADRRGFALFWLIP